jgi:phage baseplate assembly protein W
MGVKQKYGLRYPFTCENLDSIYMDTNNTYAYSIKSQVLHVIFTPKGQRIRDPEFGTDLIKYIFGPKDSQSLSEVRNQITTQLGRYVPAAKFMDIDVYNEEGGDNGIVVAVTYSVQIGNKTDETTVAVKL